VEVEKDDINLNIRHIIELTPTAPFNFDASLHKPDHFPSTDNAWQPGVRWQTMLWQGVPLGLKFEDRGTIDQPVLELSVYSQDKLSSTYLAVHYFWEDLWWKRKNEPVEWLEKMIRL
jgi:hypothetical protein